MDQTQPRSSNGLDDSLGDRLGRTPRSWLLLLSPLLFVFAPLISFYAINAAQMEIAELIPTLAMRLVGVLAGIVVVYAITRRVALTAFLVSVFSAMYFYFGHAYALLEAVRIDLGGFSFGPNLILGAAVVLALVPAVVMVAREPARTLLAARTFSVVGLSLTLTASGMAVSEQLAPSPASQAKVQVAQQAEAETVPWTVPVSEEPEKLPDIYYIVLDGYTSDESLAEFSGYDNSAFTDHLRNKGFFVAERSRSNYSTTFLSLAATLNMEYVNDVVKTIKGKDRTLLYKMARENRMVKTLKKSGYTYTHVLSGWGATNKAPLADEVLTIGTSELEAELKGSTMFKPFADRSLTKKKYSAVRKAFKHLESIEQQEDPQFVFAHILVPHGPYVFKANGQMGSGSSTDMANWRAAQMDDYLAQLQATNRMTKKLVDGLIARHDGPLIIIIQGDHGTSFRSVSMDATRLRYLRRHSILNAMYFSEGTPEELYPSISAVNTFRVVLNEALGADYKLLKDRAYNSASYSDPLKLTEVTDVVMPEKDGDDSE